MLTGKYTQVEKLPEGSRGTLRRVFRERITAEGVLIIKAQNHRTQERNRQEAIHRLQELILAATRTPRKRIPTRPGRAAKERRLSEKKKRGATAGGPQAGVNLGPIIESN